MLGNSLLYLFPSQLLIEMEDLDQKLMKTYGDMLQDFKDGTLEEGFTGNIMRPFINTF